MDLAHVYLCTGPFQPKVVVVTSLDVTSLFDWRHRQSAVLHSLSAASQHACGRVVEVKVHYVGHDEVTGSVRVVCVRTGTQTERSRSSARRWSTKIPTQGWYMTSKLRLRGWENSCGLKVSIWIKASHASRSLCVSDCIPGGYVK